MSTVTMKDGAQIYCKDWGSGPSIVFSHGWPLSADDWDSQMMPWTRTLDPDVGRQRDGHQRGRSRHPDHDVINQNPLAFFRP